MKQLNLIVLSALAVGVIGTAGFNLVTLNDANGNVGTQGTDEGTRFLGHITAVHYDPNGNVIQYLQTDNVVTNQGKACTAALMFGAKNTTAYSTACPTGTWTGGKKFTVIGTYNSSQATPSSTTLFSNLSSKYTTHGLSATEVTANTGNDALGIASNGHAIIKKTFTASGNTLAVKGAFLTNNGTSDTLFAAQDFSSVVNMNDQDTLAVTWDITIG